MVRWSVVIWAVVTTDLDEAFEHDREEAWTALNAYALPDLHVHLVAVRPKQAVQVHTWVPADHDCVLDGVSDLADALTTATCWSEAENRLLVLWGHGARSYPSDRGAKALETAEVAVPSAADLVADTLDKVGAKPDIIGYDACRMATVSTVLDLAAAAPNAFFVGSMVPEPASGWPYYELIGILSNVGWGLRAVASAIVEAYASSMTSGDWCLVAVELSRLLPEAHGGSDLRGRLAALAQPPAPSSIDFFTAAQGADILDDTNLVDLGALMRRLKEPAVTVDQEAAATAVRQALASAIVARKAAGSLTGRYGVAVLLGLPGDGYEADWDWPAEPDWARYFPNHQW